MIGTIIDCNYLQGYSELQQGVKGNKVPKNAIKGGNGSFIISDPARCLITIDTKEDGEFELDITDDIRTALRKNGAKRISEKKANEALHGLMGKEVELSNDGRTVENLADII